MAVRHQNAIGAALKRRALSRGTVLSAVPVGHPLDNGTNGTVETLGTVGTRGTITTAPSDCDPCQPPISMPGARSRSRLPSRNIAVHLEHTHGARSLGAPLAYTKGPPRRRGPAARRSVQSDRSGRADARRPARRLGVSGLLSALRARFGVGRHPPKWGGGGVSGDLRSGREAVLKRLSVNASKARACVPTRTGRIPGHFAQRIVRGPRSPHNIAESRSGELVQRRI
jgi:hypothetical protein